MEHINHASLYLFLIGLAGHLIMRRSKDIGQSIRSMFSNQRGEGEAGGEVKFTPEQQAAVDKIIDRRVGELKAKYEPIVKEAEGLKQFKTEYEKSQEKKTLEEQEKNKQYDEAKKTYETKINELSTKLTEKDRAIQERDINYALTNEISKQGGFTEEVLAMIRGNASIDDKGNVLVKSRDANGVEQFVPVAEGIKRFLTERPHLVKSTYKGGSGSGSGGEGSGGGNGTGGGKRSLTVINAELAEAMRGTDLKRRSALRQELQEALREKGVHKN